MAPARLVQLLRAGRGLLRGCWELLLRKLHQSWTGFSSPPWAPALAIQGTPIFTEPANDTSRDDNSSLLDRVFWMAAPENRCSIEVKPCRRRNSQKLIKVNNSIDTCPQCAHLKQKHVLVAIAMRKCRRPKKSENKYGNKKGGPFKAPALETAVLYTGETPSQQDQDKNETGKGHRQQTASCSARKQPTARMIPGGLSEARPATPEIQELADAVKPQLEEQTNTTYREFTAEEYKTQVVAGINYFVKVNVGGGRYMHVKIFRGLSGQNQDLVLVGYKADKTKDDELTGF